MNHEAIAIIGAGIISALMLVIAWLMDKLDSARARIDLMEMERQRWQSRRTVATSVGSWETLNADAPDAGAQ